MRIVDCVSDVCSSGLFFRQPVDGLAKGSAVAYSGVPAGQVREIALWKPDPQLVRVRVALDPDIPILRGTTATVQSSFTGTSTVALDGGEKGKPEITCPKENAATQFPLTVPVIPNRTGALGAAIGRE